MGSPLSSIVSNLLIEMFEKNAINTYNLKQNVKWPTVNWNFKFFWIISMEFTMELEDNNTIHFLDLFLTRKEYGIIGYNVYRKKIHIDNYLYGDSHHHPA